MRIVAEVHVLTLSLWENHPLSSLGILMWKNLKAWEYYRIVVYYKTLPILVFAVYLTTTSALVPSNS